MHPGAAPRGHQPPGVEDEDIFAWIEPTFLDYRDRLAAMTEQIEAAFPGIWTHLEAAHDSGRARRPAWCWITLTEVAEVVQRHYPAQVNQGNLQMLGVLGAFGAWRASGRPIVAAHDDLAQWCDSRRADSPLDAATLVDPGIGTYCVYLALSDHAQRHGERTGLFYHLDWDEAEQRREARLLKDLGGPGKPQELQPQPVYLPDDANATVATGVKAAWQTGFARLAQSADELPVTGPGTGFDAAVTRMARGIAALLGMPYAIATSYAVVLPAPLPLEGAGTAAAFPPDTSSAITPSPPQLWMAAPRQLT